jgi:hypothetical protein
VNEDVGRPLKTRRTPTFAERPAVGRACADDLLSSTINSARAQNVRK